MSPDAQTKAALTVDELARLMGEAFAEISEDEGYSSPASEWGTDWFCIDGHYDLKKVAAIIVARLS